MPAPLAVLFDFDGVLSDTANVHVVAWERTLQMIGFELSPEACLEAAEIDDLAFLKKFLAEHGVADDRADLEGWVRRKFDLTLAMLVDEPRIYPGVERLLARLQGRVRLGIVSTAWRSAIEAVLAPSGLLDRFEVIVAKEDVARMKPDPEPYRTAVARLGLEPSQVVAVEDSPTGLASASAAGLRCLAVGHRRADGEWAGEVLFVKALSDLADVERILEITS